MQIEEKEADIIIDEKPVQTEPKEGAKEGDSPAPEGSEGAEVSSGAAKPVAQEEPWHKSERFTKLTERARKAEERLEKLSERYEEVLRNQARFNGIVDRGENSTSSLSPESRQAAISLAKILKEDPETAEILGLSSIRELQTKLSEVESARSKEAFNSEFDKNLGMYSEKSGISKEELSEMFEDFISDNEFFGAKDYRRGMVDAAFKVMLFGRQDELKTRETNLSLIKEKQIKKTQGVESSSKGAPAKKPNLERNISDFLERRVREEGGLIVE